MGWRGALRSIAAASRRHALEVERQKRNQARALESLQRHRTKVDALMAARLEAEEYEETIEALVGIGRSCGETIDWASEAAALEPRAPFRDQVNEQNATKALESYAPTMSDRLLGSVPKRQYELRKAINAAIELDQSLYDEAYQNYTVAWTEWKERQEWAARVLNGGLEVYGEVLQELSPFAALDEVGGSFNFEFSNRKVCCVEIDVKDESVVPEQVKSLTSTGKLTVKPMPLTKKFEVYQDYVCGSLFKVARELFAVLPLRFVACSAFAYQINRSTGLRERVCIATLGLRPETLRGMNFLHVDFSDAVSVSAHRMSFSKKTGFEAVRPFAIDEFDLSDLNDEA